MTPSDTPSQIYLDTLVLYYEEEIMGEAYFYAVARKFTNSDHVRKMELMAKVERHAANAVLPLLERHNLTPRTDADLHRIGLEDVDDGTPDWDQIIAGMKTSYPDYMPHFRALEDMAPEADKPRLAFLTEHEVAAIEFLTLEVEGHKSIEPMLAYLNASPAIEPLK